MNKVFKGIYGGIVAAVMCMGLTGCDSEDNELVIEQEVHAGRQPAEGDRQGGQLRGKQ